eukprot:CCRYP_008397-RA/>CCRYP_008397-RA protein AED:0.48 eAED:0.74 QI:96/0/0.33/1/0/0/3/0/79
MWKPKSAVEVIRAMFTTLAKATNAKFVVALFTVQCTNDEIYETCVDMAHVQVPFNAVIAIVGMSKEEVFCLGIFLSVPE